MKKNVIILLVVVSTLFLNSCGTILGAITHQKRPVWFYLAPNDLEVKANDKPVNITMSAYKTNKTNIGNTATLQTSYYTQTVKLPYKEHITLQISSASQGKKATIELKPKRSGGIFFLNIITFPIVGHIIDGITKNNRVLSPRDIDVPMALDGKSPKQWRKSGKLKRLQTRNIRKGK
jgi:hypothetical protein